MPKVFVNSVEKYDLKLVEKSIRDGLNKIGFKIPKGKKILIKPNLIREAKPEEAVTTHPIVIEAVVRIFKGGNDLIIGDSPGGVGKPSLFEGTGVKDIADRYNVKTSLLTDGVKKGNLYISKIACDVDMIINLPKLKTHSLALYTGAVKNMFGCLSGLGQRMKIHRENLASEKLYEALFDTFEAAKPALNIMDAVVGMEGDGPSDGTPIKTGYILVSKDAVSLDLVAMDIADLEVDDFIKEAKNRSYACKPLVVGKYKKISYTKPRNLSFMLKMPFFGRLVKIALGPKRVRVNEKKCIKCYKCKSVCPVGAISIEDNKFPWIDKNKCIKCFCCQEVCPVGAIDVKNSWLFEVGAFFLTKVFKKKKKR